MSETSNTGSPIEYAAPSATGENRYGAPPEPPVQAKKKRGWLWLFWFLLLFASGSSYFAYQLWWQLQDQQAQQTTQAQHDNAASKALQQDIKALQQQLQDMQGLKQQHVELQQHIQTLQGQQQDLQKAYAHLYNKVRRTGDQEDWSVAEVGYLLRIAQQRLSLGKDLSAALQALRAADQRLRNAGPLFLSVREQLAKDIQHLQSLELPDIEGMALRLAGYAQRTEELPLLQGKRTESSLQPQAELEQMGQTQALHWRDVASAVLGKVSKAIVIRYNDSADTGLLSPVQRGFLTDNLRVKLETARLLLLTRDTQQFHLEIKTLLTWLQRYYDLQNKAVEMMRSDLEHMQKVDLKPELPDVSKSLAALEQVKQAATVEDEGEAALSPTSDAEQVMQ